ncbi:hypothetical protein EON83_16165 [bacterium]|nr:MAG: hypothetical protein EON83_16165 [bacterium]
MNSYVARLTPVLLLMSWAVSGCGSRSSGPIWNMPELMGQPIDVVKQKLGDPQSTASTDGITEQTTWTRDGATLSANWKISSKRVKDWTLMARDDSHAVREEEKPQLLQAGQLKETTPEYTIDYIESPERPLFFTGVHITPALKNHSVTLRLTGTPASVRVAYTMTGPQAKTERFVTMTDWQEKFTLPDDTQISTRAYLDRLLAPGTATIKLEILVDDKVVSTAESTGNLIICETEL